MSGGILVRKKKNSSAVELAIDLYAMDLVLSLIHFASEFLVLYPSRLVPVTFMRPTPCGSEGSLISRLLDSWGISWLA